MRICNTTPQLRASGLRRVRLPCPPKLRSPTCLCHVPLAGLASRPRLSAALCSHAVETRVLGVVGDGVLLEEHGQVHELLGEELDLIAVERRHLQGEIVARSRGRCSRGETEREIERRSAPAPA
jgi:hypothetical protein